MTELTDEAKTEIRQFLRSERMEEAELREKRTQIAIAIIAAFGVFLLGSIGSGVYFLIGNIAESTAEKAVEERLTQAAILSQQKSALNAIVGARVSTKAAEVRAKELEARAEQLLKSVRNFSENFQKRQQELALLTPLLKAGGDINSLATDEKFIAKIRGNIEKTPTGMIAAFFRDAPINEPFKHCPSGWSAFKKGWGRVIVGAGPGQGGLSDRNPLSTGGSEEVELLESHLPKHNHNAAHALSGQPMKWYGSQKNYPIPVAVASSGSEFDWSSGASQKHPNMPPYIALFFCKKD